MLVNIWEIYGKYMGNIYGKWWYNDMYIYIYGKWWLIMAYEWLNNGIYWDIYWWTNRWILVDRPGEVSDISWETWMGWRWDEYKTGWWWLEHEWLINLNSSKFLESGWWFGTWDYYIIGFLGIIFMVNTG